MKQAKRINTQFIHIKGNLRASRASNPDKQCNQSMVFLKSFQDERLKNQDSANITFNENTTENDILKKEQQSIRIAIIKNEELLKKHEDKKKDIQKKIEQELFEMKNSLQVETNNLEKNNQDIRSLQMEKKNMESILIQKQEETMEIISRAMVPLEAVFNNFYYSIMIDMERNSTAKVHL